MAYKTFCWKFCLLKTFSNFFYTKKPPVWFFSLGRSQLTRVESECSSSVIEISPLHVALMYLFSLICSISNLFSRWCWMFLQVSCLFSSLQSGCADVLFLSLHIKAVMPPSWGDLLLHTPKLGCGAISSCKSGRGSAWSFYWHLFACRWLINIKQLFPCKPPCWMQVEHMFRPRAGPRIWIPWWARDTRGCSRSQRSSSL